jgi:hypothetical protein
METLTFRKGRQHFDTAVHPHHITFDDGTVQRVLPWNHFVEARWTHAEPAIIELNIAEWLILIGGHNLASLFAAIGEQTLLRISAHPDWDCDRGREPDTFATSIRFVKLSPAGLVAGRPPSPQLHLDPDNATSETGAE